MRAAVMRGERIVTDTLPEPVPGAGQVLVRTLACGICGSDLHMLHHSSRLAEMARQSGAPMRMDPHRDIVMGHEFSAEVLDYGPDTARTVPVGSRVCCLPIALGPAGVDTIGYSNDFPGGYGERMVLQEGLLLPVPNGLSSEHAALTEPMAVGVHAVEKARLAGNEVSLVVGCGPVGLAVIAALKLRGAGPVVAADFSAARRAFAERLGADAVVDPAADSPYRTWEEMARPPGYDPSDPLAQLGVGPQPRPAVVFECVGVPGILQQILDGAPRLARVVVAGVCMDVDRIAPFVGIHKELNVQFVFGYSPEEFADALRAISEGKIDVAPLITGKVGVDGVAGAFDDLANPDRHAKILVEPWRSETP